MVAGLAQAAAPPQAPPGTAVQAPPADASTQPNLTSVTADFVPGEKTLFYDDFTDVRSVWFIHDETWDGPNGPDAALRVYLQSQNDELYSEVNHAGKDGGEQLGHTLVPVDFSQPVKEAIWTQNGRLRV